MGRVIVPTDIARSLREEIRGQVGAIGRPIRLTGLLATDRRPSITYAQYTRNGCDSVGIDFDLRRVEKFDIEEAIRQASEDPEVHGVMVYYPVFGVEQDNYVKDLIDPFKDVEGLHTFWLRKLYRNERTDPEGQKAILPCTPLAILKLLEAIGEMGGRPLPLQGRTVTIFNRSEVVGRPLASMMANDGARVFSFDVHGPIELVDGRPHESSISRSRALEQADIVITGVPSRSFPPIAPDEVRSDAVLINFSTIENISPEAADKARAFIPRVGPMTVTMALRNTLRLYRNYHRQVAAPS